MEALFLPCRPYPPTAMFGRTLEGKPEATFFKARKMSKHVKKRTGGTPKVSTLKQVSLRSYLCDDLLDQVLGPLRHVPQGVHHALSSIFGTVRHHDHRRRVNCNGESRPARLTLHRSPITLSLDPRMQTLARYHSITLLLRRKIRSGEKVNPKI